MEQWKYVSENTTDFLSLHDCDCEHIYYTDDRVIMKMEWMEILESHPNNMFAEHINQVKGLLNWLGRKLLSAYMTRQVCRK